MSNFRIKEFEALRGLAILLLLALHSEIFDPAFFGEALRDLGVFVASFLLGSFFFLAGYFTESSLGRTGSSVLAFIRSKFIRIYPPYWFALALFVFVMGITLKRNDPLVYLLNLQAVFAPVFAKPVLTLWYISMLVVFYILYGSMMLMFRSSLQLFIASVVVFFLTLWAHLAMGLFDPRFFQYYFMFLAGVFFCRFEPARARLYGMSPAVQVLFALVSVVVFQWVITAEFSSVHGIYIIASGFFMLTWILLWLTLFRTRIGDWSIWARLSTASFFAYLIHRPLWRVIDDLFGLENTAAIVWVHLIPGTILALIIGYLFQRGYDRLLVVLRLK